MTPREYWNHYVEQHGGPAGVAERLGIPYSTIAAICNGTRGIGRVTARRMVQSDPLLDRSILLWVEAMPSTPNADHSPQDAPDDND